MPELQRLRPGHAPAVLAFEQANRAYFAASISDRGDEYFDQFAEQHSALLDEQRPAPAPTTCSSPRTARSWAGSTCTVSRTAPPNSATGSPSTPPAAAWRPRPCGNYAGWRPPGTGCASIRAATTHDNIASQKVLTNTGFVPVGPADPAHIGGKQGTWYQRDLPADPPPHQPTAPTNQAGG